MANVPGVAANLTATVGGSVVNNLSFIDAVVADVPASASAVLAAAPGVVTTADVALSVTADDALADNAGRSPEAVFPESTGASQLGAEGVTGHGVNVAVLDTGIDPLPDFAGRLVDGVDLSGEGNAFEDSYGHGTFVAGIIAGDGASSDGVYAGEAPGAGLVSVKVAGRSGTTDLASVLTGIGWVLNHRGVDDLGVLNVSMGAQPWTSTVLNPLDQALEVAWHSGITVVTSAGNDGPFNGTILTPGDDPLVITAGALDDLGTPQLSDDTVTAFSSAGPTSPDGWVKPDLVAPGRSVVSLRAPGSTIDTDYPSARIGAGNFVGSGTSFSAAVTSGAAALVLQGVGSLWAPDTVKARLLAGAAPGPVGIPFVDGHGSLDVYDAVTASSVTLHQPVPVIPTMVGATVSLQARWAASTWNGLEWNGLHLNEAGAAGLESNGLEWNGLESNGLEWNGLEWNGAAWNGLEWNGLEWDGAAWNGLEWNGLEWNGLEWNGLEWN